MEPLRVLLTHSEGRLEGLKRALTAQGFEVTHRPLIQTELLMEAEVKGAAELLHSDWLLFTSRTAVRAWTMLGLPLTGNVPKLGVVGEATAEEIARSGGTVALTAEPASAQGLLTIFQAHVSPPARVGLPCGEQALPTLQAGLIESGFSVSKTCLYRTVAQPLPAASADLIVLASPSAVAALPETLTHARLVALGPSTHQAVRERGWRATESRTPDVAGVVGAVWNATRDTPTLLEAP